MQKINFQNFPNTTTPLSATNLNAIQTNVEDVFNGLEPVNNIVGKNIIPVEQQISITTSQSVYVNISAGTYTISGKITGDSNYYSLIIFNKNGNEITSCALDHSGNLTQQTITLTDTIDEIILYSNSNWSTSNGQTSTFNELQLEKGSTATSYVEHNAYGTSNFKNENIVVGSIRSKNMFNINTCIGGLNNNGTISESEKVSIISVNNETGTIVFTSSEEWRGIVSDYIEIEASSQYILSLTSSSNQISLLAYYYDASKQYLSATGISNSTAFTTPSSVKYVRFSLVPNTTISGQITLSNIQLEKGTTATSFAPYQGIGYVSGSNSNGNYIKYDDGTLICYGNQTLTNEEITTVSGAIYRSTWHSAMTYPIAFISPPIISNLFVQHSPSSCWLMPQYSEYNKTSTQGYYVTSPTSQTITTVIVGYIAIGRWK